MSGMKKTVITLFIAFITVSLFAQDTNVGAYTVKEAVDYALKNSHDAKNAKLDIVKAKAFNWEILTQGLPQVNGSFEYDHYFKTPIVPAFNQYLGPLGQAIQGLQANSNDPALRNTLSQFGGAFGSNITFVLPNDITAGLTVSQLLFDGRYLFGLKARRELAINSHLQSDLTDQDIKTNVEKAYYQAEAAQEAKSLLTANQTIVDKILSDTRAVFAQGLTEETDVNRLELVQGNLQSQINQQNNLAEVALANLKYQMGLPLSQVIILKDKLDDLKGAALPTETKFDPQNRIEYQLLNNGITLKGYDAEAKKAGYYPSLAAFLNYSGNVQTQAFADMFKESNWYQQGIVGLKINVPLFDSGLKNAQIKQTRVDQMKLKNDLENFKNGSTLQYLNALSSYNTAISDEVIAQKTLDLSKKIYDRNQQKFKLGAGTSFELEQAEQEYTTNILKHVQSIMSVLNAKADLDKAMGVK